MGVKADFSVFFMDKLHFATLSEFEKSPATINRSDQNRLPKAKWEEAGARKWFLTLSNGGL